MWLFDQSASRNVHFDPGFIQLPPDGRAPFAATKLANMGSIAWFSLFLSPETRATPTNLYNVLQTHSAPHFS